jgi:proline dehydrogenase
MNGLARNVALGLANPFLRRAGRAYLVGRTREEAVPLARRLMARGCAVVVAYWQTDGEPPARVLEEYLALVEAVRGYGPDVQVAVKAPALGMDSFAVATLAKAAAHAGVGLAFDSHAPEMADGTLRLAAAARSEGPTTVVALPSRWRRSVGDARALEAAGLIPRIVKGQWADAGEPAWPGERDLRGPYLRLVEGLVGGATPVMVATHDAVLMEQALRRVRAAGTPGEAQFLVGLPARRALAVAARHDVPDRFYVAYGHPSLAYSPASVLRRPRLAATLAQGVLLGSANQWLRQRELRAARSGGPGQ